MREVTVAARVARGLMEFAVSKGASRQRLAERSGIELAELEGQENRVPLANYVALMRVGQELCKDPALALHFGDEVSLSEISMIPFLGSASGTIADDFAQLNRYAPLDADFGGGERFHLRRIEGQLWMIDARPNPNDFPEWTESLFARALSEMRRTFGETQFVRAVHVTHGEPAYLAEYSRIFRVPVLFESDKNALLFSDDFWPPARTEILSGYAAGVLRAHAEALLGELESSKSTRGRVERLLAPILRTGGASVKMIAGRLGVSRQTLFRKLKAEGVTFERVLDELRRELALQHLITEKLSVNETACLVGFSDRAAFSRAFKRWTGSTPRAMRVESHAEDQTASGHRAPRSTSSLGSVSPPRAR